MGKIKKPSLIGYKERTLEEDLDLLQDKAKHHSHLSIKEILEVLSGKGRWLILVFLSLPFCQPLQIPGFSTPFGVVIAFIGLRMAFGKNIWLPERLLKKEISSSFIQKITEKSLYYMHKMRRFTHPRLSFLCDYGMMRINNGLLVFVLGILLALPLPIPLTNFTAGWSILFLSFGLLEEDGLFVILGYGVSLLTLLFFIFMLFSIMRIF